MLKGVHSVAHVKASDFVRLWYALPRSLQTSEGMGSSFTCRSSRWAAVQGSIPLGRHLGVTIPGVFSSPIMRWTHMTTGHLGTEGLNVDCEVCLQFLRIQPARHCSCSRTELTRGTQPRVTLPSGCIPDLGTSSGSVPVTHCKGSHHCKSTWDSEILLFYYQELQLTVCVCLHPHPLSSLFVSWHFYPVALFLPRMPGFFVQPLP